MRKVQKQLLGFCLLLLPLWATAQIVNIEDRRSQSSDTIMWLGGLNLGFNLEQNGNAIFTFNGGISAEHVHYRHLFLSFTNFNLVRIEEQDFVNDGFQHFRYNYQVNPRITWEAFAQAQYNEKIRLRFRGLLGTGPRLALLAPTSKHRAYLGALYMYEYNEENEKNTSGGEGLTYHRDHRLSSYIAFRFELGNQVVIANTSYYQPLFTNFDDLRLSSQTSLQIGISKKLKFRTTFSILYDSRVPEEVNNTLYKWINGIKWDF